MTSTVVDEVAEVRAFDLAFEEGSRVLDLFLIAWLAGATSHDVELLT